MRILLTITLIGVLTGCTDSGRNTAGKDRPSVAAIEVKRSNRELILDAILHDVLNNPSLKDTCEFYGTAGAKRIALVTSRDYGIPWSAGYEPLLPGWTVLRVEEGDKRDPNEPRLLGIRIDKFSEKDEEQARLFGSPIELTILNAGGSKNGAVIGGCSVYYHPKRVGGKWVVELAGSFDP